MQKKLEMKEEANLFFATPNLLAVYRYVSTNVIPGNLKPRINICQIFMLFLGIQGQAVLMH